MNNTLSKSGCAACKMQRKKCRENCVLAPYFPQEDHAKFLLVHRVFGKSNLIKLVQDLPVEQRGEAVSSIVYEARERVRDPVHGCFGVINDLEKKVEELQTKLAAAEAGLQAINMSLQQVNMSTLYHEGSAAHEFYNASLHGLDDDVDPLQLWEPLWT